MAPCALLYATCNHMEAALKTAAVFLVVAILLPAAGPNAMAKDGFATLAFCKIEDVSGNEIEGLIHICTNYRLNDRLCTNGLLFIHTDHSNAGGDTTKYCTAFSFGERGSMDRESIASHLRLKGLPGEYCSVMEEKWGDTAFYMKDVSHTCDDRSPRQRYTTSIDTIGGALYATYRHELTDRYELSDSLPVFIEYPDSFANDTFWGGTVLRIDVDDIQRIAIVPPGYISDASRDKLDTWKENVRYDTGDQEHIGFRVITDLARFTDQTRGASKPSHYSIFK